MKEERIRSLEKKSRSNLSYEKLYEYRKLQFTNPLLPLFVVIDGSEVMELLKNTPMNICVELEARDKFTEDTYAYCLIL